MVPLVQVDILSVNDTLYQGELLDYFLRDGELSGIILKKPRRFDTPAYINAKAKDNKIEPKSFWRPIPSQNLYFFADKILNINLTYLTVSDESPNLGAVEKFLEGIGPLAENVGKLTVSIEKPKQN